MVADGAGAEEELGGDVARACLDAPTSEPLFRPQQIVLASIGGVGFLGPPDHQGTVSFGYGVAPEVEGRGYATEAVQALLHHAFATGRINRALADTAHDNPASQRVLEKAGLRRTSSDENLHHYQTKGPNGCAP